MKVYFDNVSAYLPSHEVVKYTQKEVAEFYGSTAQTHSLGQKAKAKLENSRTKLAFLLKVKTNTLFFASTRTEANNTVINYINNNRFTAIISSIYEPPSILETLKYKSEELNIPIFFVKNDDDTGINLPDLKQLLEKNQKSFVSLSHVNQFTGRLLPITRVSKLVHKYNSIFHSDMSHTLGKVNIDLQNLNIDIITASADLFGGIRGAAFIYAKSTIQLNSIYLGNNNEYKVRSGTENIFAISTMVFALEESIKNITTNWNYIKELKLFLKTELDKNKIDYSSICFSEEHFLPYIVNIKFNNELKLDTFLIKLDLNDIYVSNTIYTNISMCKNVILSFCPQNFQEEIKYFIKKIVNS